MTTIKLGDKTLEIHDGVDVSMNGDKITVTPKPIFIPQMSLQGNPQISLQGSNYHSPSGYALSATTNSGTN